MPLIYVVPQRVQSNLDLTDQATVLTVAFSVTNFRYSALLPITADRADDRVLSEFGVDDLLPLTAINDATIAIPIDYEPLYVPLNMYGGGQYSLTNSITYVSVGPFTMANDGGSALETTIVNVSPNPVLSNDGGSALEQAVTSLSPALLQSVVPNGSTYAAERDTVDPYISTNVVLLVPADGGNGSVAVTDSIGHGISVAGNTAISTTQAKFGGSSLYFDGAGDYLTLPNSNDWAMGTGDFTVEGWVYPTTLTPYGSNSARLIVDTRASGGGPGFCIAIGASGYPFVFCAPLGWNGTGNTQKFVVNTWNHFAFVRRGNEFFFYVNGQCGLYLTVAAANFTDTLLTIGAGNDFRDTSANYKFQGYMDALRITKGVARYIEKFTPPTVMFPGPAVVDYLYPYVSDPYSSNVVLALDFDANGIVDHKGHTITRVGNTSVSTVKTKLNKYSLYFDGTGDYVYSANSVDWAMGTGNYTFDAWVYPTQTGVQMTIFDTRASASSAGIWYGIDVNGKLATWGFGGAWAGSASPKTVNFNAWNHVAFVRNGTNFYMFLNGNLEVTFTGVGANSTDQAITIGGAIDYRDTGTTNKFVGYMDSVRITKGVARWSANFVPPSVRSNQVDPYANKIALHLPFEGAVTDLLWEVTGKALTKTGTINLGGVNDAYKGQSCAMFTTDSYLTVPTSTDFNLSSGDFTIEMWVNSTATNQFCDIVNRMAAGVNTFTAGSWLMSFNSTIGNGVVYLAASDFNVNVPLLVGTIPINDGRWHHVAWTRSGSTHTIWVDGVQDTTVTWAGTIADLTTPVIVGTNLNYAGRSFVGSMDDLRITKGVCRYYTAFNPELDDPFWNYTSVLLPLSADVKEVHGRTTTTSGTVTPAQTSVSRVYNTGATYFSTGAVLTPADTSMEPGSGDFTYEFWFYTSSAARQWFFAASSDYWVGIDYNFVGAGLLGFWLSSNGTTWNIASADPGGNGRGAISAALNKWNHVALVRKGTSITMYVNGVADKTITVTAGTSIVDKSTQQKRLGNHGSANYPVVGYMQDFRFTKGVARYTTNFVPCDCPAPTTDSIDKYWASTKLLMSLASDISDARSHTFTSVGTSSAVNDAKFGQVIAFTGSNYLTTPANADFNVGTGDFTIECWVKLTNASAYQFLLGNDQNAAGYMMLAFNQNNNVGYVSLGRAGVAWQINFTGHGMTNDVWYHLAISRKNSANRCFINGVQIGSTVTDSTNWAFNNLWIGAQSGGPTLTGAIRELRITNGVARYTGKFTPSTKLPSRYQ